MDLKPLQPDQVEIAVCAVGLNFRDLLFVLRLLPQKIFSIGCEVSGFISRAGVAVQNVAVGDAVFAAKSSKTPFPSHAIVKAADVLHLPPQMTFQESMLLPTNFTSAYVGLIQMGNLKQGDHILIHTASGGVGIWAIFLAQEIGAVVWATAGSRRKRAYLKSLGIPSNHLFSSRDDNFRDGILQAAEEDNKHGRVIDVVLNSITGEGLKEASLSLCKQGARWVEMSKLNIWKVEEISQLRSDIKYHIMDLSDDNLLKAWREAMPELRKKLDGRLASMPITTYGIEDIRNALTHFERAKHVGKIVVLFPFEAKMDFKCNFTKIESPMFNSRSLYMLVGGLGGIGLKVLHNLKWSCKVISFINFLGCRMDAT
jgi:NADPH:quinone reductase-like Zn-dependent oxidoreductase